MQVFAELNPVGRSTFALVIVLAMIITLGCSSSASTQGPYAYSDETLERDRAIALVADNLYESERDEHLARVAAGERSYSPTRPGTNKWTAEPWGRGGWKVSTTGDGVWLVEGGSRSPTYLTSSPTATPTRNATSSSRPTDSPTPYIPLYLEQVVVEPRSTSTPEPTPTPYPANTFPLASLRDDPPQIAITAGTRVTWVNDAGTSQSVESCADKWCSEFSGGWASGEIPPSGTYSRVFPTAGTFYYRKNGKNIFSSFIHVTSASSATNTSSASTTECPDSFPEYTHPQGKWSICLPTNWTIDPVPGEAAWDMYGATPQFKDGRGVAVSELANYGPEDLEAVTDFLVQATGDKSVELEVISYDSYDWYGYDAYILELTTTNAIGQPMRRFLMTVAAKGNIYSLEVFCPSYLWSFHENTMVTIVDYFLVA